MYYTKVLFALIFALMAFVALDYLWPMDELAALSTCVVLCILSVAIYPSQWDKKGRIR